MPDKEFLGDRKKALEEQFFDKQNRELVEKMRSQQRQQAAAQGLAQVSGISDEPLLRRLAELGIEPDTWAAISLVPLVEVAWADGAIEDKERRAVLTAAQKSGVEPGSPSHALLESWLTRRPDARLFAAWGEYIVSLCANLGSGEKERLRDGIVGRARQVAESAGGILGIVNKTSPEEEKILRELEKAFER